MISHYLYPSRYITLYLPNRPSYAQFRIILFGLVWYCLVWTFHMGSIIGPLCLPRSVSDSVSDGPRYGAAITDKSSLKNLKSPKKINLPKNENFFWFGSLETENNGEVRISEYFWSYLFKKTEFGTIVWFLELVRHLFYHSISQISQICSLGTKNTWWFGGFWIFAL